MSTSDPSPPSFRSLIETRFAAWARFVARRPGLVLLACALLVLGITPQARHITADTHPEKFLLESNPTRVAYGEFKDLFGSDNFILVTIESDDLFTLDVLEWLRDFHDALEEEVPHVASVDSLINARTTRGEGDELIVEDLFEDWPESEADVLRIREIVRNTPVHQRTVIGDDERHTSILVELDPWIVLEGEDGLLEGFDAEGADDVAASRRSFDGADEAKMVAIVEDLRERFARPDVTIGLAGLPVMNISIVDSMGDNATRFILLSVVAVALVLGWLLRRTSGVLLPLVTVFASLLLALGFIGLRGVPVNMTAQILPSFLLAVGASASIHLLVLFYRAYDHGASREDALVAALGHAGLPISMACMTTAAGLASFLSSGLNTVRDIGVIAPVGILAALLFVLTLLPALIALVPLARRAPDASERFDAIARLVVAAGDYSVRHPRGVLLATAMLAVVCVFGARSVVFDTNPKDSIEPSDPFHEVSALADEQLGGMVALEMTIDTGETNGLFDPGRQRALDELATWVDAYDEDTPFVRKTLSVNDVLKEIHQALNENRPEFYTTPDDRDLIAQELLLFENSGSDDLEDFVDSDFRTARMRVLARWDSAGFYSPRIPAILEAARERFPDSKVDATGIMVIIVESLYETQAGAVRSYAIALLTITPMMMLLVGTFRGGLASMVPNLIPILIVLGAFGWLGLELDIFATMTGSIAIGLAVDDTIHFFHSFYREFAETGDSRLSVRRTLESTGRALLTTTIVLGLGFAVFMFSTIVPVQTFGLATTLAIALAFLADIMISPALVTLATRGRQREGVAPL